MRTFVQVVAILLLVVLSACTSAVPIPSSVPSTDAPEPTELPEPTRTPQPTKTKIPTLTPRPTPVPTELPDPVIVSGSGDSIVDAENPYGAAIVHITGNAGSHHFAVMNYDTNGNQIDLLVNTTDPYEGVRPLDFRADEHTTRFEVKATGEWQIEILPIKFANSLSVPGTYEGSGDDVLLLLGGTPDLAKVKGNAGAHHFAILSYGKYSDLLVNTTDVYEGTVLLSSDVVALEIDAEGSWSIQVTSK